MTAEELAELNRKRIVKITQEIKTALRVEEKRILQTAIKLSSGTTKLSVLSQSPPGLNHPYGFGLANRRGARGAIPNGGNPGILNSQSGVLSESWDTLINQSIDRMLLWNMI